MNDMYGTISLTKLGEIVRAHPELVKEVKFKDGHTEKMISVNVNGKQTDNYGNAAYIKVACKEESMKLPKARYYLCDLKERPQQQHVGGEKFQKREDYFPPEQQQPKNDDLPF